MRKVKIRVHTYGKFAKYGPNVYKVGGEEEARLLRAAGWAPVHSVPFGYTYLAAPAGQGVKNPIVETIIPDPDETMQLAVQLHSQGQRWRGQLHGWGAAYRPEERGVRTHTVVTFQGPSREETRPYFTPASFNVGGIVWGAHVSWPEGQGQAPSYTERAENIVRGGGSQ